MNIKEFVKKNGNHALKMHVFRLGNSFSSQIPPFLKGVEGRLVMVKTNDNQSVQLILMDTLEAFKLSVQEYELCCNNTWLLDKALISQNPEEWERQSNMVSNAYRACGFIVNG